VQGLEPTLLLYLWGTPTALLVILSQFFKSLKTKNEFFKIRKKTLKTTKPKPRPSHLDGVPTEDPRPLPWVKPLGSPWAPLPQPLPWPRPHWEARSSQFPSAWGRLRFHSMWSLFFLQALIPFPGGQACADDPVLAMAVAFQGCPAEASGLPLVDASHWS
jgi:hypothetical protein